MTNNPANPDTSVATRERIAEMVKYQVSRLIVAGVPAELGISDENYRDQSREAMEDFVYDLDSDSYLGLTKVVLIDNRIPLRFLMKITGIGIVEDEQGIDRLLDIDEFSNYPGVRTEEGIAIIQGQYGNKHRDDPPYEFRDFLEQHSIEEQGEQPMTIREGLIGWLQGGATTIFQDWEILAFPGSIYKGQKDTVPCLWRFSNARGDDIVLMCFRYWEFREKKWLFPWSLATRRRRRL
jgi:hypothetical protein